MKRDFARGFVSAIVLVGLIGTAAATTGRQTVEIDYNNIKVTLDDEAVSLVDANGDAVEPFSINGTTYLPVRAISSALGLNVDWDQEASTVILTTSSYNSTDKIQNDSLSIGDIVTISDEYGFNVESGVVSELAKTSIGFGSKNVLAYDINNEVYISSGTLVTFLADVLGEESVLESQTVVTNESSINLYPNLSWSDNGTSTTYSYKGITFTIENIANAQQLEVGMQDGCICVNRFGEWLIRANDILQRFGIDKTVVRNGSQVVII